MELSKDVKYDTLSVAVCDDSALMRNLISRMIEEVPNMKVVGKSMNGQMLYDLLPGYRPDVIVLDIEMPVMNGVEFLRKKKTSEWDMPVIILSSIATKGAAVTMECLELGASDFITKPGGSASADVVKVQEELIELIASYGGSYARRKGKNIPYAHQFLKELKLIKAESFVAKQKGGVEKKEEYKPFVQTSAPIKDKTPVVVKPVREGGKIKVIAIGISTGGPNALREVFKNIDPDLTQPILVVQHMPADFTREFAGSLDKICPLTVVEASDRMELEPKHVYIAPGNYHICVESFSGKTIIRTNQEPPRNGHRPSADVLFESVSKLYQNNALGVVMTGMGKDGAAQLAEMRKQGAWTLGQDQDTSIVYGMPKVAFEMGGVQKQVPLSEMAGEISRLAKSHI